jgi:hypothetical protein
LFLFFILFFIFYFFYFFILFYFHLFIYFCKKKKKKTCVWCMHGRRSQNLELIPLDPDIDRTLRRTRRAPVVSEIRGEMGDRQENIPEHVEQPIFENENARAGNGEQAR